MDSLDPIHSLTVFVHTLIQRAVINYTANACILKFRPFAGTIAEIVQLVSNRKHRRMLVNSLKYIFDYGAFFVIDNQSAVLDLIPIRATPSRIAPTLSLDTSAFARSYSNVLPFLLCNELKKRTIDISKLATFRKLLFRTEKSNVLLFKRVEVIEIQFRITSETVILKYNDCFKGRIGDIIAIQDFIQCRSVIFRSADFVYLPINNVIAIGISVEKNSLFLSINTKLKDKIWRKKP